MTLGETIRSGFKWLAFGKIGNRLSEFAFGIILARLLVPADFGMIATVNVFTGFVGLFAAGGMGQSLIRAKHADADDFSAVFTLQFLTGIAVYAGFFFAAPWIAHFFDEPLYTALIRVSALSFLLRPLLVMRNAWLTREMNFKSRTLVEVATGSATGAISALMAFAGMGVWSLAVSGLVGSLFKNFWLARLTPLKIRLNFSVATMRRHSGFGARIVASDFVSHLRTEGRVLVLSKLGGASFLGLFNKGESLSRLPNQLMMSPTMEPLFRAMSTINDDIDKVKYLYYRAITLLTAYTTPVYVLLWWISEPFIVTVYGEKWLEAGQVMQILVLAGVFFNVIFPSGVLFTARDRIGDEIKAKIVNLLVVIAACIVGYRWGMQGVGWGIVLSHALLTIHYYWLVLKVIPTKLSDLFRAMWPGFSLGSMLFVFLAIVDHLLADWSRSVPAFYTLMMSASAVVFYFAVFMLLPIPTLASERSRMRVKLTSAFMVLRKSL